MLAEVVALEDELRAAQLCTAPLLAAVPASHRVSADNLLAYLTLRQHDLRALQLGLLRHGLSSLGRLEAHTLDAVTRVRERLQELVGVPLTKRLPTAPSWEEAEVLLHEHTRALLGPRPAGRHVYVMVTAPAATEVDGAWVARMLAAGMNVLRINAAHEDDAAWSHIAVTARAAAAECGAALRIAVDLPGPKLRTVMLAPGLQVERWRPRRDALGRVVEPCRVALRPAPAPAPPAADALYVPDRLLAHLAPGDELSLRDARGKKRWLQVAASPAGGLVAHGEQTIYAVPGLRVRARRRGAPLGEFELTGICQRPPRLDLALGSALWLLALDERGAPRAAAPAGAAAIGCTLGAALAALAPGHHVLFDDGRVETVVEQADGARALLRVTALPGGEVALRGERGINLPDSALALPQFSEADERALAFAVRHADLVGASFVRHAADVRALQRRLTLAGAHHLGMVLKIETGGAFARLPEILLAAMERAPVGIMIARGDLAIETGYERLAELQEEILWLCEAAHLPVIWATQVLDTLARTGRPSRAEVTDAAMAVRAECVMLNKGPYVAQAASTLDDILRRMEQHQYKKRSLYRRLHLSVPTAPHASSPAP